MGNFRKLGRHAAHRVSMLRTMVSQLVKHERIETTVAKAKEVRRKADQMVQLGKDPIMEIYYIGEEEAKAAVDDAGGKRLIHFIRQANDLHFAGTTKTTISLIPFVKF